MVEGLSSEVVVGGKVYKVVYTYSNTGEKGMAGKYSKMWFKVHEIVSKAQKDIYNVVEDICRLVSADLVPYLEELKKTMEFTYVIEPMQGDGDILRCVPCLFIDAKPSVFEAVKKAVTEKFSEVVSESRLIFERKPVQPMIEQ
jgi:hypothetical protein